MIITEKYTRFLEALKANPHVEFLDNFTKDELPSFSERALNRSRESVLMHSGIEMTDDDLQFVQLSGLSVCWHARIEGYRYLTGSFIMNGFTDALSLPSHFWQSAVGLPEGKAVPEHLKHYETLNWFEHQADVLDGRYGCFLRRPGKFPPPVIFFNSGWYVETKMSLEAYLTALFETYAVRGWQFFYVDFPADMPGIDDALEDMATAVLLLPKVFPDKNWSYHINKYNEVLEKVKR